MGSTSNLSSTSTVAGDLVSGESPTALKHHHVEYKMYKRRWIGIIALVSNPLVLYGHNRSLISSFGRYY